MIDEKPLHFTPSVKKKTLFRSLRSFIYLHLKDTWLLSQVEDYLYTKKFIKFNYGNEFNGFICTLPFEYGELTNSGDISVCCYLPRSIGNVSKFSFKRVWNSHFSKKLRKSMLNGSFEYCDKKQCRSMQYKGGNLIKKTEYEREDRLKLNLDSNLKILSLGNDYSCNLKCPSCRSDILKMSAAEIQEQLNRFNKLIDSIGSELKLIHIAGDGDPFASQFYHQIIAKTNWVRFPNLSIRFQTNGNALTPKKWDVLPAIVKKKTIEIGISIDGASKGTYEKLRLGGDFGDVMNNLSFLSTVPEVKRGDIKLNINMIVQVDNFREIINFIEMGQRFSVHTTSFTYLRNWGTFSDFEYKSKAVHLPSHPLHNELLDLLKNPLAQNSNVDLGNLSHLI